MNRHRERGQVLVEFVLAIMVAFTIMFGIIDFGRALYTYDAVAAAARIGSRYAIVHGSACTLASCPATQATIAAYVDSKITGLTTSQLTITPVWSTAPGCGDATFKGPQCLVTVTASYPFKFILAFGRTVTMTSSSQMVISQ